MTEAQAAPSIEMGSQSIAPAHPNKAIMNYVLGYPRIACRMSLKPETAIFRSFSALNARNLLYMQAELCRLEDELMEQEKKDNRSSIGEKHKYATDWGWLRLASLHEDPPIQLNLLNEIKRKLREYNEALLQQARLQKLKRPDPFDLRDLQHFLNNEEMMGIWSMTGDDSDVWGSIIAPNDTSPDLVGIQTRYKEDRFSTWVADHALIFFKCGWARFKKASKHSGSVGYYESSVLKITFLMTSIVASMLPIASIVVLVVLSPRPLDHTLRGQIGTIAAFNVLISMCLTLLTDAKRTDVFAVTAAFTAVQAVFLGMDSDWKSG